MSDVKTKYQHMNYNEFLQPEMKGKALLELC